MDNGRNNANTGLQMNEELKQEDEYQSTEY